VQLEAGTFDARTLRTTISERAWTIIEFKVESSRTLRENPSSNWRTEWTMYVFLKALEEVCALEPSDRFMESASIWKTISLGLAKDLAADPRDMGKLSKKYVI